MRVHGKHKFVTPVLMAAAAALGTLSAAGAQVQHASVTISPGTNPIQIWGLQSENANSNYVPVAPDQALLDAAHFAYITAHPIAYQGQVGAMKAINPNVRILAYENSVFVQPWQAPPYYDPTWYLKDATGKYVTNPSSGNYLMDPTNPGWIQTRITGCQQLLAQSGYDGCFLDMLGLASLRKGFVSSHPINPHTNQPWALTDWIANTATLAADVTSAVAPSLVMGNGINSGGLYYSPTTPTKALLDAMDGGIAEAWLRGSTISISTYHEGTAWVQDTQVVGAAEAAGKPLLGLVKVGVTATQAQLDSWQQYGLATFLMGTQGRSAYFFSPNITTSRTSWYSIYNLLMGPPTASMSKLRGTSGYVYWRKFTNGLSIVNNNLSSATVKIPGGPYYDINGKSVSTTALVVPGNTGLILRKVVAPITTVTGGPSSPTTATSASISFSSNVAGATFTCAIDGGAAQPCTSPVQYSGLALGAHLVNIQTTTSTNGPGAPVPFAWDISDGNRPTAGITSGPANGSGSAASFTFTSSEPESSFTCSLDGAAPVLCTSPYSVIGGVTTGVQHTMTVAVTDPYGVPGTPATWTWTG